MWHITNNINSKSWSDDQVDNLPDWSHERPTSSSRTENKAIFISHKWCPRALYDVWNSDAFSSVFLSI